MNAFFQSNLPNIDLTSYKDVPDLAEQFLLLSGMLSKSFSRSYIFLPIGLRVKRKIERRYEVVAENLGFEPIQFPSLEKVDTERKSSYDSFKCLINSHYLKNVGLIARSEESVGRLISKCYPSAKEYSIWTISKEYRATGGSGGFRNSIEYEQLVAYQTSTVSREVSVEKFKKLIEQTISSFEIEGYWETQRENYSGEYIAHDFFVPLSNGDRFQIGQICDFHPEAAKKLGITSSLFSGKSTVCGALSANRTIYVMGDKMSQEKEKNWPISVTPYDIHIIVASGEIWEQLRTKCLEFISNTLSVAGFSTLIDDRNVSIGKKITDSDILKLPYRVVISKTRDIGFRAPGAEEIRINFESFPEQIIKEASNA